MRDVNYMCEAVTRDSQSWWTIDGGYCLPYSLPYQTLGLDSAAVTDQCTFSIKCALSGGLSQNCVCKNVTACRLVVASSCANGYHSYPGSGPLLSPHVYMIYKRDRDWTNKKPDLMMFHGRGKCIGYQFITMNNLVVYSLGETYSFYDYRLWEYALCDTQEGISGYRNYSGPQYDINCWNKSKTFNNRPYQVSFHCQTRCISKYRIRDGIVDCLWSDEDYSVNNSCPQIQHHRLQCSSSELTCLLAGELGNRASSCSNGRDEFDDKTGLVLSENIVCNTNTDPGCVFLRKYIQTSSEDTINQSTIIDNALPDDHSATTIPFRSYCNSFFDTNSAFDESAEMCSKWICMSDEYQCLSGQCIPLNWLCDGNFILFIVSIIEFIL